MTGRPMTGGTTVGRTVHLGALAGPHVRVTVVARAYPGGLGDLHGWLQAEMQVRTPASSWRFDAFLRESELARFRDEVRALRSGSRPGCELLPRDPWVALALTSPDRAAGSHACRARGFAHEPDSERQVEFECVLDETELARLGAELDALLTDLPQPAA